MLQKVMKFLKIGQAGLRFVPKAKTTYGVLKRFHKKKKKPKKRLKKIQWKSIFEHMKKGMTITKEYCFYMRKIFLILKER